jgi:hypothetical protein
MHPFGGDGKAGKNRSTPGVRQPMSTVIASRCPCYEFSRGWMFDTALPQSAPDNSTNANAPHFFESHVLL